MFWKNKFMDERRSQWLRALDKFQYQVKGQWYDAVVNKKGITGNTLEVIVSFPHEPPGSQTITGVRIMDVTGNIAGEEKIEVARTATQGVLTKFEFPIYEKGDV